MNPFDQFHNLQRTINHMHRITVTEPVPQPYMPPGVYVADDPMAAAVMTHCRGTTLTHCDPPPVTPIKDGDKVLFVRAGGYGDLLLMTPTFRALKGKFSGLNITVASLPGFGDALMHNPNVDAVELMPLLESKLDQFDVVVWCENVIENNESAKSLHACDLYAKQLQYIDTHRGLEYVETGIPVTRKLDYFVQPDEVKSATAILEQARAAIPLRHRPKAGAKRVAIQPLASSPVRTYPPGQMVDVARRLVARGCEVVLLGKPGSLTGAAPDGVLNLTQLPKPPTFRESCAVVAQCDVVLCPDSAMLHVACALGVPTVSLFAAFDPLLRVTGSRNYTLRGVGECVGCGHHSYGYRQFPDSGMCAGLNKCIPLAQITPERIAAKVMQRVNEI